MQKKLSVEGMTCEHCVKRVKKIIEKFSGVSDVQVVLEQREASFTCEPAQADVAGIVKAINEFGYSAAELPEKDVTRLYADRGTSEQFHAEIKSDMDMERLPSGKFATNALILTLGGLAYNILRAIGQLGLVSGETPVRHIAKRRRIKTVMQELMYLAARLVRTVAA